MNTRVETRLADTGERMIPTAEGEVSLVFSRHQFAYRFARQFVDGRNVLDIGCGSGYGCKILAERAKHVLGIDHDGDAIAYCRNHFGGANLEFRQAEVANLDSDDEFDVAVSFQVIEHVRDTDAFVRRMKRAVTHGGIILITTPNVKTFPRPGEGNPFHFSEMNYEQFTSLLARHFGDYEVLGIGYLTRNWLRSIVQRLPLYRKIGLLLKRSSRIKRVAARAMEATRFTVLEEKIAENAIDLLAVCRNEKMNRRG